MQRRFLINTIIVTLLLKLLLSNYVYTDASALTVIPLWNIRQNGSYPCNLYKDSQNVTTFAGNSFQTNCEVKLISSNNTAALLQLPEEATQDAFLYAERKGDLLNCQNRFLVITDVRPCSIVFWHQKIQLYLKGNTSIFINEMQVTQSSSLCPKPVDVQEHVKHRVSQTNFCCIKEFNHSVSCTRFPDNSCVFYDFPYNCDATLNDIAVVFQCYDDSTYSNYTALLMYPSDVVSVDLTDQNIVRISGSPFRRLHNLKVLDLGYNKLSVIDPHSFQELDTLTFLSLRVNHLSTLDGSLFQSLQNLETLVLAYNKLSFVDPKTFQGLDKLTFLSILGNGLVSPHGSPFQRLQNLKTLILDSNKLSFVDPPTFLELDSLTFLSLTENLLVTLHVELFTTLNMLQRLNLNVNNIYTLQVGIFQNLISLTGLYLDRNNLTFLHRELFSNLTVLTHLRLDRNRLVSVSSDLFKNLPNLYDLKFDKNQIISLDQNIFSRASKLKYLDLSSNYLTVLPRGLFKSLKKLISLYLYENNIATLDEDIFNKAPMLISLNLADNALTYLPSKLFSCLRNLISLFLNDNEIISLDEKLFNNSRNLRWLFLHNNNISVLPHDLFAGLILLEVVDLRQNQIISLSNTMLSNVTNIIRLDLSRNKLSILPNILFREFSKLQHLDLHENRLVYLDSDLFNGTRSLAYLYLHDNKLVMLPNGLFQELISLTVLTLHSNKLKSLPSDIFAGLFNLESLFLQDNYIPTVGYQILHGLQSLRLLNLSHSSTNSLDFDLFQDTGKLEFLDLSSNKLESIPNIDHLNRLTFLNLQGNSLIKITDETFSNISKDIYMVVSQPEICKCYVSGNISCNALDDISPYLTCSRLLSDRILVVMMWLIGLSALFGNIFVLTYRKVKHDKDQIQTFLLSNLAMSDLLMGIYMLLIASADIYFGESFPMQAESWRSGITCKIAGTISIVSSEASVFFLTLISIDRYINIKYPYSDRKLGNKSSVVLASILWFTSLVLGIVPSSFGGNSRYMAFYDNSHVCIGLPLALIKAHSVTIYKEMMMNPQGRFWYEKQEVESEYLGEISGMYFSSAVFLGLNCICFLIVALCYVEIVRDVIKSPNVRVGISNNIKEEIRLTVNVSVLILTDFVCWFPIIILGILVQAKVLTLPPSVFAWCVTFILPINSAINPFLYTIAYAISNYQKQVQEREVEFQQRNQRKNSCTTDTKL